MPIFYGLYRVIQNITAYVPSLTKTYGKIVEILSTKTDYIKAISDVAGEEVVQVYISRENTPVYTFPLKKLVAFARVDLKPGESKTVTFTIAPRQLSIWQEGIWKMLPGEYSLFVGSGQEGLSKGINRNFEIKVE